MRVGENLNRWRDTLTDTVHQFINEPTQVDQEGTPINITWLNEMETGIFNNDQNKVDKVTGKELSTNDFTNAFQTKLNGIQTGAQVNRAISSSTTSTSTTTSASSAAVNSVRQLAVNAQNDVDTLETTVTGNQPFTATGLRGPGQGINIGAVDFEVWDISLLSSRAANVVDVRWVYVNAQGTILYIHGVVGRNNFSVTRIVAASDGFGDITVDNNTTIGGNVSGDDTDNLLALGDNVFLHSMTLNSTGTELEITLINVGQTAITFSPFLTWTAWR